MDLLGISRKYHLRSGIEPKVVDAASKFYRKEVREAAEQMRTKRGQGFDLFHAK